MLEAQHFSPPWMYTLCICWGAKSTWVIDTWKKKILFHSISCWLSKYYKLYYIKNNIIRCLTWIEQNPLVSRWHSNYKWENNFVKEMHISLSPNHRFWFTFMVWDAKENFKLLSLIVFKDIYIEMLPWSSRKLYDSTDKYRLLMLCSWLSCLLIVSKPNIGQYILCPCLVLVV